ncbi:MAG: PAS domain S-box protein [Phycisphaerales bacterium]
MPLRVKLILIFLVIALVPMVLLEILIFNDYKHSIEASQLRHLQDVLAFNGNNLETYFTRLKNNIAITSNGYLIRKCISLLGDKAIEPNNREYISVEQTMLGQIKQMQHVLTDLSDIMLVNTNGKVVFSLRPSHYYYEFSKLNEAQKAAFIEGRNEIFFSDVYYDSVYDKRYEILITAPVHDYNNVFTGLVVFEMDMAAVYKVVEERTALGKTGEAIVAKKINNELVYLSPLKYEKNGILIKKIKIGDKLAVPLQNAVQGKTGAGIGIDYRGEQIIAAWEYLPTLGWGMVVKIDTSEAFKSVRDLRKVGIITLIGIFLASGIVAFYVSRSITKPLKLLTRGAQIIGSGNLDCKVSLRQKDEIGQLSRMFDKMTSDLKLTMASRDDLDREVAERKRTEEILKRSEAKYRELVQNANSVILRLDRDGNTTFFNEFAEKFFGYSSDEIIGKSINLIVPQQESSGRDLSSMIADICNNPDKYASNVNENICKDGRRVWINWANRPIFNDKNELIEILCVGTDITELKNAEERVRQSEERYRSLFENMLDGYAYCKMIYDDKGKPIDVLHLEVNKSFSRQMSVENVVGKRVLEVVPELSQTNPEVFEIFGRVANNGAPERFTMEVKPLKIWISLAAYCTQTGYFAAIFENITERKRAEDALRLSEERLQFALESCHIGAWDVDLGDHTAYESLEHSRIFGYSEVKAKWSLEELLKHAMPEYHDEIREMFRNAMVNKTGWSYECQIRRADGEIRWIWFSGRYYKNIFGRERVAGVVQDITERKEVQQALQLERERLDFALKAGEMGVWRWEIQENKNYGDEQTLRMHGTTKEKYDCGIEAFFRLVNPEYHEKIKAAIAKTLEQNVPYEAEYAVTWPDGSLQYLNARGKLERDKNSQPLRIHGLVWCITERVTREKELARLNRMYKALSDSNQAMMHADDEIKFMQELSNIIQEDCGYSTIAIAYAENDEFKTIRPVAYTGIGKNFLSNLNISWGDNIYGNGATGQAIRTGNVIVCRNLLATPSYETWRNEIEASGYKSSIALPLKENNKAFGAITIFSKQEDGFNKDDISLLTELSNNLAYGITLLRIRIQRDKDRLKLEQLSVELKRSNTELENFANIVSHDLREPLRAITGFMELLQIQYKDKLDDKGKTFIDMAINGGRSMRNMLLGLLEYSRVQTEGKKFEKVNTNNIVKDVINNLSAKIVETETEITHNKLPVIKCDDAQFMQLIQNLVQNAIKFRSEKKPKIHIACKRQEYGWLFSVQDNGIGIDKQYHENIFMIFQRVHRKEEYEGTGVGLSVCKRIVERHKGQIWVESELGKGSTFFFTIPE